MKRRWNVLLWTGFLLVLVGLFSYVKVFALFPITRDFPWVNILLLLVGGALLMRGLHRAFKQPEIYRGKVFGPILTALSAAGISLFIYGIFIHARQLPPSTAAPHVGQKAPQFTLPDQNGQPVSLANLLSSPPPGTKTAKASGVLLIFYRGHW